MNRVKRIKNPLFELEARIDRDLECGATYWVVLEFGPTKEYWPHVRTIPHYSPYGRRFVFQFYLNLHPVHFSLGDRDKFINERIINTREGSQSN